jgi:hypothetical protein
LRPAPELLDLAVGVQEEWGLEWPLLVVVVAVAVAVAVAEAVAHPGVLGA